MFEPQDGEGRHSGGWTLWREIYGTAIGTAPFVIMLVVWGSSVQNRLAVLELEVQHAKSIAETDRNNARDDRKEASAKLDKIIDAVATLQQQVARQSAVRSTP